MKNQQQQLWMRVHHHLEGWILLGWWGFCWPFQDACKKCNFFYIQSLKNTSPHAHTKLEIRHLPYVVGNSCNMKLKTHVTQSTIENTWFVIIDLWSRNLCNTKLDTWTWSWWKFYLFINLPHTHTHRTQTWNLTCSLTYCCWNFNITPTY